jgi:3-deoxy-D-manno-octulosonic-acid transferase
MVAQNGFKAVRRSRLSPGGSGDNPSGPRVIVLDTRGELAEVYRYAVLSFVGGTLVPVGGHNLLEPAVWGKPVFFGPYTDHCAEVAALLLEAGGGIQVRDGADLGVAMMRLLKDRSALRTAGTAAQQVVTDNRGAVQRSLEYIGAYVRGRSHGQASQERSGVAPQPVPLGKLPR